MQPDEVLAGMKRICVEIVTDIAKDAQALDRTPFTPRGMGETFGTLMGTVAGLAGIVAWLLDQHGNIPANIGDTNAA